jgi:hypothetical protein
VRISITKAALGLFILVASPVGAETLSDGRALNPSSPLGKYLFSMDFFKGMHVVAYQADRTLGIGCDGKYDIKPLNLVVLKPVELPDGAPQATSGAWAYRYDAVRCGAAKRYNMLMIAQPGAAPRANMLLPGDSIASPQLMMDAVKVVGANATSSLGSECKELQIFDTALTQGPHTVTEGDKAFQGVWKESWTFQGCGKQVAVPVTFIPDGKGGTTFAVSK